MENRNACLGNTTREASQNYNFNFFWMGFKGWQGHCCCPEEIFPVPFVSLYLLWILKWFFFKDNLLFCSCFQKYGPEGVFYLLHQSCFEYSSNDYKYTICPFDSVKQSKVYSQSATILGRSGLWTQLKQGDYLLSMGQGDASLCPDGQPRETKVTF